MLMPLDPLHGWEISSSAISFMAPQKCSARHLPAEHCCSTWTKNKSRYKWLAEFHSRLNVFYLPARKVPYFCSYSTLFGGISSVMLNVAAPEVEFWRSRFADHWRALKCWWVSVVASQGHFGSNNLWVKCSISSYQTSEASSRVDGFLFMLLRY